MKLPWMQFYPADYLLDTQPLTPASRGIWMDAICILWRSETRGTLTLSLDQWTRLFRCDKATLETALMEFNLFSICDVVTNGNGHVTVRSRRMARDEKERKSVRLRVRKYRRNKDCNAPVQECNRENQNHKSESEVISQISESEEEKRERVSLKRPTAPRGCVYPEGFNPDQRSIEMAQGYGFIVPKLLAAFKDHHVAHGTIFKDWQAAFRTWIRKEVKFNQRRPNAL